MKYLKLLIAICFSVTLLSCSNEETKEEIAQSSISLKNYTHSAFEIELLDLINQDRVNKGLTTLSIINEISYVGSTHNDHMIANGAISHDNFQDRAIALENGLGAITVGENVASGFNTSAGTLNAWNNSPAHKANLEGNYTHFGLSVKEDAAGEKYYTLMFVRK